MIFRLEFRHRVEQAALSFLDRLINVLPHRAAHATGNAVATLGFWLCRKRIREGRRRLRIVFGNRYSPREERRIIRRAWNNLASTSVDVLRSSRLSDEWLAQNTNITALKEIMSPLTDNHRGAVIASAHIGSWEMAAIAGKRFGLPVFAIAAPQKNPYFNAWMVSLRERAGIETLMRGDPNLIRKVVKRLKAGNFLAILPDLRYPGAGIETPFFGHTANIGPGMALFARMAGVPIVPFLNHRLSDGRLHFYIKPEIFPDPGLKRDADITRMTIAAMRSIETVILEQPDQWFWFNKRWILDPVKRVDQDSRS